MSGRNYKLRHDDMVLDIWMPIALGVKCFAIGATATDHGASTARTANLPAKEAEILFGEILLGKREQNQAELFRAQMLTEMAKMSQRRWDGDANPPGFIQDSRNL